MNQRSSIVSTGRHGMREAISAFDWPATPLGPRTNWPQSLRTTVEIMLASRFAMFAAWGPDLTFLYNDAYAPFLGARHPGALGRPMADVWPDVWDDISPLVKAALDGESTWIEDMHLVMTRNGYDEDTWWSFSYSPLRDDDGNIAGLLDVAVDMTQKVMNERALQQESAQLGKSEERFRALVSATADVIYRMSADWREMSQIDGRGFLADTDAPSVHWLERYIPPEERAAVLAAISEAMAAKSPFELEHRVIRADGTPGWTLSRAVPILDASGEIREWFGTASDITGAHESRAALATSREKLELATRAARLGQFDYWPGEDRLEWDDRCRELFGVSPGRPVSYDTYVAGLHPDDRAAAVRAVEESLDPRGSRLFEAEYRTIGLEDGLERHVHARGTAFFDGDMPRRLIGTVQDVTADRRAQAKLRETSERLRLAGRATNDAIWDWDLASDHVAWNEALESVYGHAPQHVDPTGAWWIEHIHPEDRDRIDRSIHAVIDGTGTDWKDEYRFRRGDGSYADIKDRGYVIRDGAGHAVRMIGAMLDQTDRKDAERTLERAKAGLEEAVAERTRERDQIWLSTPDLLCVATPEGWYRELNPAWQQTLGWTVEELKRRPYVDFVHPDDVERTREAMSGLVAGESVFGFENRYLTKDGDYVWLSWNAVPRENLVYGVVRDVTAAHRQAEALAKVEEQLRQAQKMEAVGQLTGGIAHDFNNMLTGVIGALELLQRFIAQGRMDRVERYIEVAMTSAQRAAGLTQRLLAFSRRQSLDVRAVDVNRVVAGVEDLLRRTVGENIVLELSLAPDTGNATTDANQLESALLNLAINARDAMPDGGRLAIGTAHRTVAPGLSSMGGTVPPGDYVAIAVSDTGTGMEPDVLAKAFDPFFTTKPIGQGTGLGLSMIYGFVRQSGGYVDIASKPGAGTTVTLYLRHDRQEIAAVQDGEPGTAPGGRGECILVVEDDPAVRLLVVEVLGSLGYAIIQAADGREAMRILEEVPPIRLLLTDVGLPGMNGRQLADYAREKIPGLHILFMTGYAEHARIRSDFLDIGMDMITKPFVIDELASKVREMIAA
ncbi:MAG: PAS domain-containing protein [Sphingobium sp.]